jgi:hypothetical protein
MPPCVYCIAGGAPHTNFASAAADVPLRLRACPTCAQHLAAARAQARLLLKTPRADASTADKALLDACGPPRGAKDLAALVCVSRRLARELQQDVAAIAKCARASACGAACLAWPRA